MLAPPWSQSLIPLHLIGVLFDWDLVEVTAVQCSKSLKFAGPKNNYRIHWVCILFCAPSSCSSVTLELPVSERSKPFSQFDRQNFTMVNHERWTAVEVGSFPVGSAVAKPTWQELRKAKQLSAQASGVNTVTVWVPGTPPLSLAAVLCLLPPWAVIASCLLWQFWWRKNGI